MDNLKGNTKMLAYRHAVEINMNNAAGHKRLGNGNNTHIRPYVPISIFPVTVIFNLYINVTWIYSHNSPSYFLLFRGYLTLMLNQSN